MFKIQHRIHSYYVGKDHYASAWIQVTLFGKNFCFWQVKKRIKIGK
jgi:hypothetical protein